MPLSDPETCTRQHCDALCGDVIDDRDGYHEWADNLAHAIATAAGVDIGEHSNLNDPWRRALDAVPLIAAQALRAAAAEIRSHISAPRARIASDIPLDVAAEIVERRADELERGTDR